MRFQLLAGALVVSLIASGLAFAATRTDVRARPDLVVSSISNPPDVVMQGGDFPVRDRTRNMGSATARATVTQYYLTANGQRTAAGRRSVVRLRPHRSSTGSAMAKVALTLAPGTYSLVACADGAGSVREANERNNCRTAATTVVVKKPPPPV
jgi:subtilase family serine protease